MGQQHPRLVSRSPSVTGVHEHQIGTWIVDSVVPFCQDLGPGLLETVDAALGPPSCEREDCRLSVRFPFRSNPTGQALIKDDITRIIRGA
jgi:hypothetical protein